MTPDTDLTSNIDVALTHSPLAFLYRLFTPTIQINELKERRAWGRHRFPLPPGTYTISVSYPWFLSTECGKASVRCDLGPGQTRQVHYCAGLIRYLPGKISVT